MTVSSSSELKVRDEAGNVTTLSPHNFDLIPEGPSEDMAWSYYSERDGKRINVDMLKAVRLLEQLSGEQLVFTSVINLFTSKLVPSRHFPMSTPTTTFTWTVNTLERTMLTASFRLFTIL